MKRTALVAVAAALVLFAGIRDGQARDLDLRDALRAGGHVILLRHALAPGTGDPADFQLRDCSTQRNLSDTGREQARRIGAAIKMAAGMPVKVLSSQWCRCLETARLLGLGDITERPGLNSFFQRWQNEPAQTAAVRRWLRTVARDELNVLVTHQVNITALTGVSPRSGEMVVVAVPDEGDLRVVARFETD